MKCFDGIEIVSISIYYKEEEDCFLLGLLLCGLYIEKDSHSEQTKEMQFTLGLLCEPQ